MKLLGKSFCIELKNLEHKGDYWMAEVDKETFRKITSGEIYLRFNNEDYFIITTAIVPILIKKER